jgi:predicted ATPase
MITQLTLRNFKSVGEQVYDFTGFDLLVGRNNSGKSAVLRALAIDEIHEDVHHVMGKLVRLTGPHRRKPA